MWVRAIECATLDNSPAEKPVVPPRVGHDLSVHANPAGLYIKRETAMKLYFHPCTHAGEIIRIILEETSNVEPTLTMYYNISVQPI